MPVQRSLRKEWKNKGPKYPYYFTRRIRWYEGDTLDGISIRLELTDESYRVDTFFTNRDQATQVYEKFIHLADTVEPDPDDSIVRIVLTQVKLWQNSWKRKPHPE